MEWRLEPFRVQRSRAASLLRSGGDDCAPGLIVVAGTLDPELEALLPLLRRSQMAWIAILDRDDLDRPLIRDLVAEYCYDFLTLPLDPERLRFCLGHLSGMASLIRSRHLHQRPSSDTIIESIADLPSSGEPLGGPGSILGNSPAMAAVRDDIVKVAASDYPVLIQGESGTGKELASRAIHEASARRDAPFVAVNCASLSPTLIHAELFGHERGAFTGATHQHKGHLEAADGGTILLDEIGDLSLDLQLLLLRFLDQGTLQRVGGCTTIAVDARIIAATHVDLEESVREGRFRQDLYYRLHVLSLAMPPLREREDDAELLARGFLERFAPAPDQVRRLAPSARLAIQSHRWPGNVRELINRVRRALVMSDGETITAQDLGLASAGAPALSPLLRRADVRDDAERALVCKALEGGEGKASRAASLIGVSRATFYRMMDRHG
ncbi:MAG: sigma 54-interacting transcriptional regulator, partial [Panacagrimonas sp.]